MNSPTSPSVASLSPRSASMGISRGRFQMLRVPVHTLNATIHPPTQPPYQQPASECALLPVACAGLVNVRILPSRGASFRMSSKHAEFWRRRQAIPIAPHAGCLDLLAAPHTGVPALTVPLIAARGCVATICASGLDWWTRHRSIRAEHAAITFLRAQPGSATGALVKELARIGRHRFGFGRTTCRADYRRFQHDLRQWSSPS